MDPNANLREQRELVKEINAIQDACSEEGEFVFTQEADLIDACLRLAALVGALDDWITHGGFLPEDWHRSNDAPPDWVEYCPHCGAGPADASGELPHFRDCQDA